MTLQRLQPPLCPDGIFKIFIKRKGETEWTLHDEVHNLITTDGRDWMHAQVWVNTSAGTRGANGMGVTSNATAPDVSDTVLTGEITTNGLTRAQAGIIDHTDDTNSTLLDHTFTASGGSHSNVQKVGLFNNATSGGILVAEAAFSPASLNDGDSLRVQYTQNLG